MPSGSIGPGRRCSFKQQEIAARVSAQLAALAGDLPRERFKDTLIGVLREQLPDDAWQSALAVARERQGPGGAPWLSLPIVVSPTREAIFAAYEADARTGLPTAHLGASLIGKSCERALWYDFRWTTTAASIRAAIAATLRDRAAGGSPDRAQSAAHRRHRPGSRSRDRAAVAGRGTRRPLRRLARRRRAESASRPPRPGMCWSSRRTRVQELRRTRPPKGVRRAKPQHFAQMQIYLRLTTLTRAMYLAVNKDTDDLYVERVEDSMRTTRSPAGQGRVASSSRRGRCDRVSEDPAWYECRMCDHHAEVCRGEAAAAVNCRTCLASTPVEGGWRCERHERLLSEADQRAGCTHHLYLPDLVPGEQIDAGTDWVSYQLPGGGLWCDHGRDKFQEAVLP
jgi:hypothetical protein